MNYDTEFEKFKQYEFNKDTMCPHPFLSFYPSPRGDIFPCCVTMKYKAPGTVDPDMNLDNMINTDGFKTMRTKMISGERPVECTDCWKREDSGIQSDRQQSLKNTNEQELREAIDSTQKDGYISDFKIKYLEFRDSNICNYRCRFCNVNSSSKWVSEWVDMRRENSAPQNMNLKTGVAQSGVDWSKIDLSHLTSVHMAGGEPIVMDSTYELLDNLIANDQAKNIEIGIVSNTSKLEYKKRSVLDLFNKFKYVNWSVSMDGLGKTHDYLRAGGLNDWEKVDANIWKLHEWVAGRKFSSSMKFHTTMNWNNAFQWWDVFNHYYLQAKFPLKVGVFFSTGPTGHGINELPNEQIQRIIDFYEPKNKYPEVQRILTFCKNNLAKTEEENKKRYNLIAIYKAEQIYLDESRKQNFLDVFPEWEEFWKSIDLPYEQARPIMRQIHNYLEDNWPKYFNNYEQTLEAKKFLKKTYAEYEDELRIHGPDDPEVKRIGRMLKA